MTQEAMTFTKQSCFLMLQETYKVGLDCMDFDYFQPLILFHMKVVVALTVEVFQLLGVFTKGLLRPLYCLQESCSILRE